MASQEVSESTAALDALILPGTPRTVRDRYHTLAERAKTATFGLLEDEVVVLDTETTGLSFKDCELIEISAALLRGREVTGRYQTFVHPGRPIPPEIRRLTGITDLDVTDAPSPVEAVAGLARFAQGRPVLAHNATFDRTFVEKTPGGADVSPLWIDTLQLSRIALPRLSSHRLADLARAFGCDSVTHRATDDVDALCGVWRVLLCALSDLPHGLLARLAQMHPERPWQYRDLFTQLAAGARPGSFSLRDVRRELLAGLDDHVRMDARERQQPYAAPSREEVAACFTADGVVGRMYPGFEPRSEQVSMACEVRDALATSTHRAIEAGTGVGKSIAYLLPAVLFAQANDVTVGVATKTNALTDQLVSHELPALNRALPQGVRFASLKGYEHYPCLARLERATREELPVAEANNPYATETAVASDMLDAIAVTYAYACQSPDGDLDALGIRWRSVPRRLLTTTAGECPHSRSCPFFPRECLVYGARRRAAAADVVVTNHSLLLCDAALGGGVLPPIRHWVVDEAHGFEVEARRQWASELSAQSLRDGFEHLGGVGTGALRGMLVRSTRVEGAPLVAGLVTKLASETERARVLVTGLLDALHDLGHAASFEGGYDTTELWLSGEVRGRDEWVRVREAGLAAADALEAMVRTSNQAQEAASQQDDRLAAELASSTRFAKDAAESLRLICAGEDESYVYSAQLARHRKHMGREALAAEKIDVGATIAERWLGEVDSVVFTSATMAIGNDFGHFEHAVGLDTLDPSSHRSLRLASSYDFDRNMGVVVAQDMPQPNSQGYLKALEDLLFDVHVAMGGSVLTLFTNRREMERVFERLRPRLAAVGLDLACQERNSSPRRLRERFVSEESLSLLALRSFWEGFDAAGDTLRCVVIAKLPFASPRDPLSLERGSRDQRAWWRYQLPEAVLSVKQAAGRLIRTSTDTGVLVLADSRVAQKRYGRQFLDSLPSHNQQFLSRANVGRYIELWRSSRR